MAYLALYVGVQVRRYIGAAMDAHAAMVIPDPVVGLASGLAALKSMLGTMGTSGLPTLFAFVAKLQLVLADVMGARLMGVLAGFSASAASEVDHDLVEKDMERVAHELMGLEDIVAFWLLGLSSADALAAVRKLELSSHFLGFAAEALRSRPIGAIHTTLTLVRPRFAQLRKRVQQPSTDAAAEQSSGSSWDWPLCNIGLKRARSLLTFWGEPFYVLMDVSFSLVCVVCIFVACLDMFSIP